MAHFPMYIDLNDRLCLVVGGGRVAKRKIETLLKYGPRILVASLSFHEEIEAYAEEGRVELLALSEQSSKSECSDSKEKSDLPEKERTADQDLESEISEWIDQAALVIAATSDHALNQRIGLYCRDRHIPANVIDDASLCSFVFPSVVVRGDISIGINTGTNSPALSKQIRKRIEKAIPDSYQAIGEQLGALRDYVKSHYEKEAVRRAIISQAAARAFALDRPLSKEELSEILVLTIDAS